MTSVAMPDPMHDDGTYSAEQMQAYKDACVREALKELDRKLDGAFSKLQSYDKTDDFWEGVGYSAQAATQIINAMIPGDE